MCSRVQIIIQANIMSDLVVRIHQVELCWDCWVVGKCFLARSKEPLDEVLYAPVNVAFMQDAAQAVEDGVQPLRGELKEAGAALCRKNGGDLNRVVRGILEEQHEHLQREDLMCHTVID